MKRGVWFREQISCRCAVSGDSSGGLSLRTGHAKRSSAPYSIRKFALCIALFACVVFAGVQSLRADGREAVTRESPFAEGGLVILDANVGDVHVVSSGSEGRVRLVIKAEDAGDAAAAPGWVREFAVSGSQAKVVLQLPKHGQHNVETTLYVPKRSDLKVHLDVGNLEIQGVAGNLDAELGVGNLEVTVIDPHAYRAVSMSVRIGDVDARVFGLEPSGFLAKSVEKNFDTGSYRLKLHSGIGNVSCRVGAN